MDVASHPIGAHEARLSALEGSVTALKEQVREIELDLSAREERDKGIDRMFTQIMDLLTQISDRVKTLESRPSKLWDAFVFALIAAAAGGSFAIVQNLLSMVPKG